MIVFSKFSNFRFILGTSFVHKKTSNVLLLANILKKLDNHSPVVVYKGAGSQKTDGVLEPLSTFGLVEGLASFI